MQQALARLGGGARAASWLAFFALVLAGWGALFIMAAARQQAAFGRSEFVTFLASLCQVAPQQASLAGLTGMWALMSLAMMAPTAVPALRTYLDLGHAGAAGIAGFWALCAGYLMVWVGFSALGAALQLALSQAGQLDGEGASVVPGLSALLLGAAGAYQFSRVKARCLSKCRAPLAFFLNHWHPGVAGGFRMGTRLGLVCVGCCAGLMLLAFVGGTMNLAFMGLATLLMTLEKLPEIGRAVTRPLGFGLLGLAALQLVAALVAASG